MRFLGCINSNTMTAKHYFCSNCGIYTHHQRRSNPNQYCYNVGCLEDVNPFDIPDVPKSDGVNHSVRPSCLITNGYGLLRQARSEQRFGCSRVFVLLMSVR